MSKEETLDDGSALIRQDQIDKRFRNLGEKVMQPLMKAAEKATQYKPAREAIAPPPPPEPAAGDAAAGEDAGMEVV
eukprot:5608964-Pyramimonas_sp.AAC.1